jgi:hypothetical protein
MYELGSILSVRKDFYRHVGVYAGNGMVFHNHPDSGQQLVTLDHFAGGRKIKLRKTGVDDKQAFLLRLQQAQQQPNSYNLLRRNCEHTASTLRGGNPSSPQLWLYAGISALAVVASIALGRATRR